MEELKNGQFWYHPVWCKYAITQWLTDDVWVLLSAPVQAMHSRTCMAAISERDGKVFYTKAGLQKRLEGWQYTRAWLVVEEATLSYCE